MTTQDIEGQLRQEIEDLVKFCHSIGEIEQESFGMALTVRLISIDSLAGRIPDNRGKMMRLCFDAISDEVDQNSLMRHARQKPFGYAGDFKVIDSIYINNTCGTDKDTLWESFFLRQPGAQAVRNRKDYFVDTCLKFFQKNNGTVLSLACGPCREILEALMSDRDPVQNRLIHLVDQEKEAIFYAKGLMNHEGMNGHVFVWESGNVLRMRPEGKYGLIWCAGLFDYLYDNVAVFLLKRIWNWLDRGGEAVVGNFHQINPSRLMMEWLVDWHLIYRREEDMKKLADQAGIPASSVSFGYEPLGINMFMHIRKG